MLLHSITIIRWKCKNNFNSIFISILSLKPNNRYEKIIKGKYTTPDNLSNCIEDLLSKILVTNPSKRLGNLKGGVTDIIKHKWFGSGFDWQGILKETVEAPFIPTEKNYDAITIESDMIDMMVK